MPYVRESKVYFYFFEVNLNNIIDNSVVSVSYTHLFKNYVCINYYIILASRTYLNSIFLISQNNLFKI